MESRLRYSYLILAFGKSYSWGLPGIDDVPSSCLVNDHELEGDLVCEWPLEDVVKLSTHQTSCKMRHASQYKSSST